MLNYDAMIDFIDDDDDRTARGVRGTGATRWDEHDQ
jgi:hypothetical protein